MCDLTSPAPHAGIFIALMLHFDISNHTANGVTFPYFYSAMGGYVAGMSLTIWVMIAFNAAQPALLYIVPCVIGAVFACALARGEVHALWSYSEVVPDEEAEGKAEKVAEGATAAVGDVVAAGSGAAAEGKKLL